MRLGKIALWAFIAFLIAGVMFGFYLVSDVHGMGGWDKMIFGMGEQYEVNDMKETDLGNIRKIAITVTSSDTNLTLVGSQKVKASLTGSVRTTDPSHIPYLDWDVSGDTLRIEVKRKSTMTSGFYSSNINLVVEIPDSFSDDLVFNGSSSKLTAPDLKLNSCHFTNSSGDMILGNMDTASAFSASTTSGRIEINGLQAPNARFLTSSGDMLLGDININDDFNSESTSGKISIDKLSATNASIRTSSGDKTIDSMTVSEEAILFGNSGKTHLERVSVGILNIEASSGDVVANVLHSGHTNVKTSSGKISVKGFEGSANLSTSSGDVNLVCDKPVSIIGIECSSGRISLELPENTQFTLDASTSSGNIKTGFPLDQISISDKHLQGRMGNGELDVSLVTTSGNIDISSN